MIAPGGEHGTGPDAPTAEGGDDLRRVPLADGVIEVLDVAGRRDLEPVLALHEGLGSAGLWAGFVREVAARTGRRVVAPSRHGHGRSMPSPRPRPLDYRQREARDALPALRSALGVDRPPILMGHSDGASIALLHAARHDVAAVVAIAPHVVVEPSIVAGVEHAASSFAAGRLRAALAPHHDDVDTLFAAWRDAWLDPAFAATQDLRADLEHVTAPVLLVQGTADAYATLRQLDLAETHLAGSVTRLELEGAGHSPHRDAAEPLLDAVAAFLDGVP